MRIVFVRHGHPNYEIDCLTEIGRPQAERCSKKLLNVGIKQVYASTCGRAYQTAEYTAEKLGLDIVPLEFMREIQWDWDNPETQQFDRGNPWQIFEHLYAEHGFDLNSPAWYKHPYFENNKLLPSLEKVKSGFIDFMGGLGYSYKDGQWYCDRENNDTVALFSHGGSGSYAIALLLGMEFPAAALRIHMNFTSIAIIDLPAKQGQRAFARIARMNDDGHVETSEIKYSN